MNRAIDVGASLQHAAVQGEARPVDAGALIEVVVHVDLAQVRRGDLGPQQLVLLHQELARLAGHPHRAVIVDEVIPAVVRAEAIHGGEIGAGLPFLGRDTGGDGGFDFRVLVHGRPPCEGGNIEQKSVAVIAVLAL